MTTPIYSTYLVHLEYAEIKFVDTISIPTLINANFALYNVSLATPAIVANAFKTINVVRDYYSISRTLNLWFDVDLVSNTNYEIRISGLKTVTSSLIDSDIITFTTGTLTDTAIVVPPDKTPAVVDVQDYSIKDISPFSIYYVEDAATFQVLSIVPDTTNSYYLPESFNEGRIEITFSSIPAANFISGEYFKVQRKLIGKGLNPWETISAIVTSSPETKLVVIYLPSNDATPVFAEPDKIYWETGYKYRLRISPLIGI